MGDCGLAEGADADGNDDQIRGCGDFAGDFVHHGGVAGDDVLFLLVCQRWRKRRWRCGFLVA